jgi:hypothetical protein
MAPSRSSGLKGLSNYVCGRGAYLGDANPASVAAAFELRDERSIDDIVLRQVQGQLDNEEVRLSRSSTTQ